MIRQGETMNRRTAIVIASAVLITSVAAAGAATMGHGTSAAKGAGISSGPTTTATSEPHHGDPVQPQPQPDGPHGTTSTTAAPSATTTTVRPGPVCRNSTDQACGEFRWDPAAGPDAPMT